MTCFGTPGQRCWLEQGAESWNRALCPPASPASKWELQKAAPAGPVPTRRAPSEAGALQEARPWFGFQVLPSPNQVGQTGRWDHKSPQVLSSYHVTVTVLVALLYLSPEDHRLVQAFTDTGPEAPRKRVVCGQWLGRASLGLESRANSEDKALGPCSTLERSRALGEHIQVNFSPYGFGSHLSPSHIFLF